MYTSYYHSYSFLNTILSPYTTNIIIRKVPHENKELAKTNDQKNDLK